MKRKQGYYWVKDYDWWIIAKWNVNDEYSSWSVCGNGGEFIDEDFADINEEAIEAKHIN